MDKIRKIGSVLNTDKDGFIINESSLDKIKSPWREAVEEIKQAYLDNTKDSLKSIYVRGSVAKGEAIEGISDIDTLAVITKDIDKSWIKPIRKTLDTKFTFSTGVDFTFLQYDELLNSDSLADYKFLIKTQSVCIYGDDISDEIENFKVDIKTANILVKNLKIVFENTIKGIIDNPDKEDIREWCSWVMKRILRAGFVLVMDKEQVFTRDLYPCYEIFAKYYAHQASKMYTALELAINPIDDVETIVSFIEDFGFWLEAEVETKFAG
jgi:predicted nucleotidyltransferase